VGAYYHDIGKMDNPDYFVENQSSGENIHNEINPSLSVSIIRSHVKRGMEKARALRLPKQIIDIIGEHHGNQVIAYFYNEAKKINPDANPEDYAYTGNPPVTRESAIVMLSDTVEAACRTLEKPSVPRLEKFISTLINGKIETKQLENCNLTFSDLTKIHDAFVQILAGYYHSRTKYPDQKDPDSGETAQIPQKENSAEEKSVNSAEEKSEKSAEKIEKSDEKSAKSAEKNSAEKNDEKPAEKEKEKSTKKSAREKKQ
jgi:putative nucleotidyltransferase with HDIG domain